MPLGVVSEVEFEKEVESLNTIRVPVKIEHETIEKGRGKGSVEIPNVLRKVIAEEVIVNGDAKEVEKEFGISRSSISAYVNDAHSTSSYDKPDKELRIHNNKVRKDVGDKAHGILIKALEHITEDKLQHTKAIDLASVAKNMSGIMSDMQPKHDGPLVNNKILVFAPRIKEEDEYEIIDVKE